MELFQQRGVFVEAFTVELSLSVEYVSSSSEACGASRAIGLRVTLVLRQVSQTWNEEAAELNSLQLPLYQGTLLDAFSIT